MKLTCSQHRLGRLFRESKRCVVRSHVQTILGSFGARSGAVAELASALVYFQTLRQGNKMSYKTASEYYMTTQLLTFDRFASQLQQRTYIVEVLTRPRLENDTLTIHTGSRYEANQETLPT